MKIAVLVDTWFPFVGGGQINALEIAKRIAKKNHQVTIFTRNVGKNTVNEEKNLKIIKLGKVSEPQDMIAKLRFCLSVFVHLMKNDFDLVNAHAFLPGIIARLIMVFKGTPAIFTVHGTSINSNLNGKLSTLAEKIILTKILYTSQITVSRDFFELKNINNQIYYIPNGADFSIFKASKSTKIKSDLLFVGRLHPQKNILKLLEALVLVKNKWPKLRLQIVGIGPLKNEIKNFIRENNLSRNVLLRGEVTNKKLAKIYQSSRILIQPSIYEGQSLAVLEAWACKLPVIVTNTGDNKFLIKDKTNGFFINDVSSAEQIAFVIQKALISKNLKAVGKNGYNFLIKNFSWQKSADETLRIYEKAARS